MFSPLQPEEPKAHNLKFIVIILAIVLIVGFILGRPILGVYHYASQGKNFIEKAEEELKKGNIKESSFYLSSAHQSFLKARKNASRLAWSKPIPWFGDQIIALESLISSAEAITGSLRGLAEIVSNIFISPAGSVNAQGEQKGEFLETLSESTALFREMEDKLEQANSDLSQISTTGLLPQIRKTIEVVRKRLPGMRETLNDLILASRILPQLFGYSQEKTYLFLFQNNTELRPAGGFIGTYGILKLRNGEIASFFTDDTYNLDKNLKEKIETPKPYQVYNKRYDWYFRDSNWSPDFPTAAQEAEWFYHLEGGTEELDGVIAITPTFIEKLLKLTGPIKVPDYPYEFTAQNFTDQIEFHVEKNFYKFESKTYRKNIIGQMGEILLAQASNLPRGKLLDLFDIITEAFDEKHFLIYLNNPELEKIAAEANWDGSIKEAEGDYFLYVDCNLASLKSDPKVKREINYEVNWDGKERPQSKLEMGYNHTGNFDWKTTRYRTYIRVYVPLGSELVNIKGNESEVETYNELGKTVFAFFKVIEPQTQERVTLEYKLPERITRLPLYTLYAQKQAGTVDHELNVKINWNGVPKEWKTDLVEDREFKL